MASKKRPEPAKRTPRPKATELRLRIDAFTPATMPMARLAEYLGQLAEVLGEPSAVHFVRLVAGSTVPVVRIDPEAVPKVRDRAEAVRRGDGPSDAMGAYRRMNRALRDDNATAVLTIPGNTTPVLRFPGREDPGDRVVTVRQQGSVEGVLKRIGGMDETIHIVLKSEDQTITHIHLTESLAKGLAKHLFEPVRLHGAGRWRRDAEGQWTLDEFTVRDYEVLENAPLSEVLRRIRAVPTDWDDKSYDELTSLRHGENGETNGGT